MHEVPITEIMMTEAVTARETDSLSSVDAKMHLNRIRHVPVVNAEGVLAGIITLHDMLACVRPNRSEEGLSFDQDQLDQFILKHVMTKDVQTLSPTDSIADAVRMMAREGYGLIPVVGTGRHLVGIVTQMNVLKWLGKKMDEGRVL